VKIQLLEDATATNGVPTLVTQGFSLRDFNIAPADSLATAAFALKSTAGSGTMTVTIRIWLWSPASEAWHPAGTSATAALRGVLNIGNAIDEMDTDLLSHMELVEGLRHFDRIYAQVVAIGGTATAVSLWLHAR
jgi:hypothetical protein